MGNNILVLGISPGFAGSPQKSMSIQRVKRWMAECGYEQTDYDWRNLVDEAGALPKMSEVTITQDEVSAYQKVICLGNKPEQWCKSKKLDYLKVPHPSGLNRQWNNPEQETITIKAINNYLAL
jgi:hypothetical protein